MSNKRAHDLCYITKCLPKIKVEFGSQIIQKIEIISTPLKYGALINYPSILTDLNQEILSYYRTFSSNMIETQDSGSKWRPISAKIKKKTLN